MRSICLRRGILNALALLALLVPLLLACGNEPEVADQPTTVPTAVVVPPDNTDEPEPPTATVVPDDTGDVTFPLATPYLQFGVVAHLYYTDAERVLQLAQNAGFDWIRQQIHWKDTEARSRVSMPGTNWTILSRRPIAMG